MPFSGRKRSYMLLAAMACMALPLIASIQNVPFIPPVYNYTTTHYRGGNQNWAAEQGGDGLLYFGNDNGLLHFDGINWHLHSLPNRLSVKSIYVDQSHSPERIYVGSFEEFGYFERDFTNQLTYHSLKGRVSDYTFHNDEIWTIYPFGDKIYFQSFSAIFAYDGQAVETLNPSPAALYLFPWGKDTMYAQLINSDFCRFDGEDFHPVVSREQLGNDNVVAVLPRGNDRLLVTSKNGLFLYSEQDHSLTRWRVSLDAEFEEGIVNRALFTGDSYIFGMLNSGLYALNEDGSKKWHVERHNGLNNNTILALFLDRERNIWAALDNGISNIRIHSPLSFFEPTDIQVGLVEDVLVHEDNVYLATNQGVYQYAAGDETLRRIPGFDIQSWFIKAFGDQIFVGHNQGTSLLHQGKEVRIEGARTGGMDMKEGVIHGRHVLIESSYTSLYLYQKDGSGSWVFSHRVEGFSDLIKNIEIDHAGNIWAGHMYKGVYRLRLDESLRTIAELENYVTLDSPQGGDTLRDHPIRVMKLRGRIVLSDGSRFYTYDDLNQRIIPYELLNTDLPSFGDTHRIVPVNDQLFWFVRNKEYALIAFDDQRFSSMDRVPFSILNNPPNEGRGNVYVTEDNISILSLNGGIARYTYHDEEQKLNNKLAIASIEVYDRKRDSAFHVPLTQLGEFTHRNNQLAFHFSFPEYAKKTFRVEGFLEGYDNRWVTANNQLILLYQNLPPGHYKLKARVVDSSGLVLSHVAYTFRINPPWYKTGWAYVTYVLLFLLLIGLILRAQVRRVVSKKNKLFEEQEKKRLAQIDKQEREITFLKNERLEADLIHKGKQVASASMMIINHSEFLKGLRGTIQTYMLSGKINRKEGNTLLNQINNNIHDEAEWDRFQENFDLIHENFFRRLKEQYPSLTPTDLKLCALLRLNYSTKEIADMLNLSVRGVETARYRLRKKLNLSETDNLVNFMIAFK